MCATTGGKRSGTNASVGVGINNDGGETDIRITRRPFGPRLLVEETTMTGVGRKPAVALTPMMKMRNAINNLAEKPQPASFTGLVVGDDKAQAQAQSNQNNDVLLVSGLPTIEL